MADRVAINLRELGIMVQALGKNVDGKTKLPAADFSLVREHIPAPDAAVKSTIRIVLHSLGEKAPQGWKRLSKSTPLSARR